MPHPNPKRETKYEDSHAQVLRREARNRARAAAVAAGKAKKGDGKEVDHLGYHRTGSLDKVKTAVVSQHENRIRQPKRKK